MQYTPNKPEDKQPLLMFEPKKHRENKEQRWGLSSLLIRGKLFRLVVTRPQSRAILGDAPSHRGDVTELRERIHVRTYARTSQLPEDGGGFATARS